MFAHFLFILQVQGNEDLCIHSLPHLVDFSVAALGGTTYFTSVPQLAAALTDYVTTRTSALQFLGSPDITTTTSLAPNSATVPLDSEDFVLCNLLYAPRRSRLHSIAKVLTRIENLGHICAWTRAANVKVMCECCHYDICN